MKQVCGIEFFFEHNRLAYVSRIYHITGNRSSAVLCQHRSNCMSEAEADDGGP
jgi:hypothetical protein